MLAAVELVLAFSAFGYITIPPVSLTIMPLPVLVGALLFSKEAGALCFLAVDPACRRQHIAQKLVFWMLTQMEPGKDITVTTYREGNPNGTAARAFYKGMGFTEGRLTEEFGCPVQEFVLKRRAIGCVPRP